MTALLTPDELAPTLSEAEIYNLTQFRQPQKQAAELRARGFVLAGVVRGRVWLPREHYNAVCRGVYGKVEDAAYDKPKINKEAVRETEHN